MENRGRLYVFGEVLYDCFPDGRKVLGGAPFNVAWHLQALGHRPLFISRVGRDGAGEDIVGAMHAWKMDTGWVQHDPEHQTGRVEVVFNDGEPGYDIVADSAYDFIEADRLGGLLAGGTLYHGTLCLRNHRSRETLSEIKNRQEFQVFLDVNLRPPWFRREEVLGLLGNVHWAKMNIDELRILSGGHTDVYGQMAKLQKDCNMKQLIVTRGEQGGVVRTLDGQIYSRRPEKVSEIVDTVGAGDGFSALYLHCMRKGCSIDESLRTAQAFAGRIIGLRGATTRDGAFYENFVKPHSTAEQG
jgi:fructokinase